jgi:hypothetical protein
MVEYLLNARYFHDVLPWVLFIDEFKAFIVSFFCNPFTRNFSTFGLSKDINATITLCLMKLECFEHTKRVSAAIHDINYEK